MSQRDIAEQVKEHHRYVTKAAYVVLGITMDERKDILSVWIWEHENSKFWLSVLNDLRSRGVMDVYLFCTDGLCGIDGGHPGGVPPEPFTTLHRPPNPFFHPFRQLEGR